LVDVVVVSYNSHAHLRDSVESLALRDDANVVVVDNASTDGSLGTVSDLPLTAIARAENCGFAAGCNDGWQLGRAEYVLFLNPDAVLDDGSLETLVARLEGDGSIGAVAPRIEHGDGSLAFSQRRFPRLRSTYAQALFLHRLFPAASWSDEIVRDPGAYGRCEAPEWVSGACILVRRAALEELAGWDAGFFLYSEDTDLCRRLWNAGYGVAFEPDARVTHVEGASAPRAATLPLLAASRVRYAAKHHSRSYALLERLGVALGSLTHVVVSRGGLEARMGHGRAFLAALSPRSST
jgi:hypothetical protein